MTKPLSCTAVSSDRAYGRFLVEQGAKVVTKSTAQPTPRDRETMWFAKFQRTPGNNFPWKWRAQ